MNESQADDDDFKTFCLDHLKSGKASKAFEKFVGEAILFVWEQNHFVDDEVWDEIEAVEAQFLKKKRDKDGK